jgi:hypothetical protein
VEDLRDRVLVAGSLGILSGLPQLYYARRLGQDLFVNAKALFITQVRRRERGLGRDREMQTELNTF